MKIVIASVGPFPTSLSVWFNMYTWHGGRCHDMTKSGFVSTQDEKKDTQLEWEVINDTQRKKEKNGLSVRSLFYYSFLLFTPKKKTKPTALIIGTTKWKYLRSQALVGTYFGWGKRVSRLLSNRSLGSRTSEKFPILLLMPSDWLQFMQISARHRKSSLSFGGSMTSIRGCTMNVLRQSQQLPTLHDFLRRNQSYFAQQISSRVLNFTLSKKQEKNN